MKKIILILVLNVSVVSFAQLVAKKANAKEMESAVELLSQNLASSPGNPLNINNEFLSNLANLIGDESTKNMLQSYSTSLGTDGDLSYRQVYWDLANVLKMNPSIASNSQYTNTSQGLNLMFDNYNLLADKLKSMGGNYELGSFLNDPSIMYSLQNITGSFENAQTLGLGLELGASLAKQIEANQKYKDDYRKLAKLSTENAYAETDINLNSALIDAYVGIEPYQEITAMYRYDFNNGTSLRVENGILKYFNSSKNIVKNLMVVDKRHDGNFYKYKNIRGVLLSTILVSPDEKVFYIYANENAISDIKCKDCLKPSGYVISAADGEIVYTRWGTKLWRVYPESTQIMNSTHFNKNNVPMSYSFMASGKYFYMGSTPFTAIDNIANNIGFRSSIDKNKKFILNNEKYNFLREGSNDSSLFNIFVKCHYVFEKDLCNISLFWAKAGTEDDGGMVATPKKQNLTVPSSSMLQIAKYEGYINPDGMVNELTGLAMNKNGDLYFTGANGSIGKLNAVDYKLDDPSLTSKMRTAMNKKPFKTYDFIASKSYLAAHGQISTETTPIFPSLKFTPDDKLLIYTVNDNLYVINPADFNTIRHYTLSCQPYNFYFTKESGDWIIDIQALNEFQFPITKKYSLGKLSTMEIKKIIPKNTTVKKAAAADTNENTDSAPASNNSNFSLADEIKKLKELLDAGAITPEEYSAAKAKLLNTPAKKITKATPTNTTAPTKKPGKNVIDFKIKGKSYCAVKAPESGIDIYGLYKYLGKEIRTYESKEGEPIVQLNKTDKDSGRSGVWQAHGEQSKDITWWLLSDCNGNLDVTKTENFDRYNIVVRYDEEDVPGHSNYPKGAFDFMSLSIYTDGSNKILILGERVKQQ